MDDQRLHLLLQRRERLQADLADVSRRINALSSPNRLPVELLGEFFAYVGAYIRNRRQSYQALRGSRSTGSLVDKSPFT